MRRAILSFAVDTEGQWVAHLSCLHRQHVWHQPPFWDNPWVQTEEGRSARVGTDLDCGRCDRAELPEGLRLARTAGPWDAGTLPPGLRRDHRVAAATWGRLRVLSGSARFHLATTPPLDRVLRAGDSQAIPPEVPHRVEPDADASVAVDFLVP